ncbi:hypothetical protein A9P82_06650 [Arachidicoccus ginsenosidimutans]|uniref:uracil-DNA glycosylase family protein n=1 Tax=Arachidicoccus sp. BS20 TaxID=1850526 RepID=UPI0007F0DC84|nr:uracil-DNA glycosylase family protein [Arachidicoccus sp. BS20]ANI89001.1 hypothetical protein A9P82_06650 [Arachidicoccus sp. BS20]
MKTEHHPYEPFIPENLEILIVGSFPGKEQTQSTELLNNWFYGAPRNQFWKIIESVFEKELKTREAKQQLFYSLNIGLADVILKAKRTANTNLDQNLDIVEWNDKALKIILLQYPNVCVLCTSKFVEKHFRKLFPYFKNIRSLPSPSPRYATMSLKEKVEAYKKMLAIFDHL